MKIKIEKRSYDEVLSLPPASQFEPERPSGILRALVRLISRSELKKADFKLNVLDMKGVSPKEPALYLMNHSCFTDLKIAAYAIDGPYNIVTTTDAFVGKESIIKAIGCIPTQKFKPDIKLVNDITYALTKLHNSVLMYPEAGYTFDGTTTTLPDSLGKLVKVLGFPVVMIRSHGAFLHDPLYNGLRLRNCKISADKYTLFTADEVKNLSAKDLNAKIREAFSFDNFREQFETGTKITEDFRAEGLSRVLYKCPICGKEGRTYASGITLKCADCGAEWELTELGKMELKSAVPQSTVAPKIFNHIPDWFAWERECVRKELEEGTYLLDVPVRIYMIVDFRAMYEVGEGRLKHTARGFHLTGCDGKLDFKQKPLSSYSINSDYFFYEIGDMISIGDRNGLIYCFPPEDVNVVAKTRLAAEELYKIKKTSAR